MTVTAENSPTASPTEDRVPVPSDTTSATPGQAGSELVQEDLLVEDVSIDGMCGVY